MDLTTGDSLLALGTDVDKRCELAYYFGLKAQGAGNYQLAADWYHVALETGRKRMGEYRWAFNELYIWYSKSMNLSNIKLADIQ